MKKLIAAAVVLAVFAPPALAASRFLKVSPTKTNPGKTVTIFGAVGGGCQTGHRGDAATIYSKTFKGATKHNFAGIPSVSASLSHGSKFSIKVKLSKGLKPGTYTVAGRCGGGRFGSAALRVVKPRPNPSPGGQFYP